MNEQCEKCEEVCSCLRKFHYCGNDFYLCSTCWNEAMDYVIAEALNNQARADEWAET